MIAAMTWTLLIALLMMAVISRDFRFNNVLPTMHHIHSVHTHKQMKSAQKSVVRFGECCSSIAACCVTGTNELLLSSMCR